MLCDGRSWLYGRVFLSIYKIMRRFMNDDILGLMKCGSSTLISQMVRCFRVIYLMSPLKRGMWVTARLVLRTVLLVGFLGAASMFPESVSRIHF